MPDVRILLQELGSSSGLRSFQELLEPLAVYDAERGYREPGGYPPSRPTSPLFSPFFTRSRYPRA